MTPAGLDAEYDLAYEHFDLRHFLLQARGMLTLPRVDPLRTFLMNGAEAKASPEPNFDMASYVARHPERASGASSPYVEWLRHGRDAGEIADPAPGLEKMAEVLGKEPAELAALLSATRLDLQERLLTGTLGKMFARAAEVEPLIGESWGATARPLIPPLVGRNPVHQVHAIHSAQRAAGFARARVVIVVSDPRWGAGRRAEGHLAHALAPRIGAEEIVVVYTDSGGEASAGRFPDGVRAIDFAAVTQELEAPEAQRALVELIRSFRADAVVGINSRLLYEAMATYGRALTASERVYMLMFCNEQLPMGNWVGIPLRFFYRVFDLVEGVLTDSDHLVDWIRQRHKLLVTGGDRLHVLRAPVDASIPLVPAPPSDPGRRPQVFWAGRWDLQKRVDVAYEVARRMPDVDLRMWGAPVLTPVVRGEQPDNIRLEGQYTDFSTLPLEEADVWLYTSAWDGVPSQLLEVAMTGVPIVGSLVGGTGEVLSQAGSWPVAEHEDAGAYEKAIRDVLADAPRARRRAEALRERLVQERTEEAYAEQLVRLLLTEQETGGADEH